MSDQKTQNNPNQQEKNENENENENSRSGAGAIQKVGNFIVAVSGFKSIKKNAAIIKHRASFPLLRRVLSNELKTTKNAPKIVAATDISEEDIDRSLFWHTIIVAITGPALIWSVFILTKALAIGFKFGVWTPTLNQGLYTSIPMIVFTASKLYVSWHSRLAFKAMNSHLNREA